MTHDIFVLLLGIASSITLIISALSVHRKRLLIFGIGTNLLIATEYAFVGSFVGLAACLIGITRTGTVLGSLKYKWLNHWALIPVFMGLHTASFITFNDWSHTTWVNFIPLIGGWAGTIAIFFQNVIYTKAILIGAGSLWLMYEFHSGIYGQMIGESLNLVANSVALTTLIMAARRGIPEAEVEDVDTHIIEVITTSIPAIKTQVEKTFTHSMPAVQSNNNR